MLSSRLKVIKAVIQGFSGKDSEPGDDTEIYVLKSMWVMLMSEFEASIKDMVESYIDKIKKSKDVSDMHICFLIQNFYGNKEEDLTIEKILSLYNKKKSDITYSNFTRNKKTKYKHEHIKKLFNMLGIFFTEKEDLRIKLLDGIASTRDSIAHGDYSVSVTSKQLKENIKTIIDIHKTLKTKLKV